MFAPLSVPIIVISSTPVQAELVQEVMHARIMRTVFGGPVKAIEV